MSASWTRWAGWVGAVVALAVVPQVLDELWTTRVTGWICLAVAALGLNLLTGINGQISAGHGAFYGIGAYASAIFVDEYDGYFLVGVVISAAVCFVVGVLVGLPALRIKGLYLALVTLSLATLLFPFVVNRFEFTGGGQLLKITERVPYRSGYVEDALRWEAPSWTGLTSDQWRFYVMAAIALVCFVLAANLVRSRTGRAMVAIRDNEIAAMVSGVPVSTVKVLTFGVSSALAGVGGAMFALLKMAVSPLSFTLTLSLSLLVAVVLGGSASVVGSALGAVAYGFFDDVIAGEVLPDRWSNLTPLILGVLLVVTVRVAPGGIVGSAKSLTAGRGISRRTPP